MHFLLMPYLLLLIFWYKYSVAHMNNLHKYHKMYMFKHTLVQASSLSPIPIACDGDQLFMAALSISCR